MAVIAEKARAKIRANAEIELLLLWVSSNPTRVQYCETAMAKKDSGSFWETLHIGQGLERHEIFTLAQKALMRVIQGKGVVARG